MSIVTILDDLKSSLLRRGVQPKNLEEIIQLIKVDEKVKRDINLDAFVDSVGLSTVAHFYNSIQPIVLGWIDENAPDAYYRSMFIQNK